MCNWVFLLQRAGLRGFSLHVMLNKTHRLHNHMAVQHRQQTVLKNAPWSSHCSHLSLLLMRFWKHLKYLFFIFLFRRWLISTGNCGRIVQRKLKTGVLNPSQKWHWLTTGVLLTYISRSPVFFPSPMGLCCNIMLQKNFVSYCSTSLLRKCFHHWREKLAEQRHTQVFSNPADEATDTDGLTLY